MANLFSTTLLMIIYLLFASQFAQSNSHKNWVKSYKNTELKETITNIQVYLHDKLNGNNPTAQTVARAADTDTSPTKFGMVVMADDPLRVGFDPKSKLVGRAQGIYAYDSKQEVSMIVAMAFAFMDGIYNGSSISLFGRNAVMQDRREVPVVGGTGHFRLARGFAIVHTHFYDPSTAIAIVGFNITVLVSDAMKTIA